MKRINKALAKISVREVVSASTAARTMHATHRGEMKIVQLSALPKRKMEALDALPISLFRVYYKNLEVGFSAGGDDDKFFETAIYRNSLMMEACTYIEKNEVHPLVGIGCDEEAYKFFWAGDFEERMRYITKAAFALEIRVDLNDLRLNENSTEDMLRDVTQILIADYKWMRRTNRALGQVEDFDRGLMCDEDIAEVMLDARIQTKLVALHTGLTDAEVDVIKRRLLRSGKLCHTVSGRIRQAHMIVAESPIHSLLFLCIYMMLAQDPERNVCGKAVVIASEQYRKIAVQLGVRSGEYLSSNNGYRLASAVRAGEVVLDNCSSCGRMHIVTLVSPAKCPWCAAKRLKTA